MPLKKIVEVYIQRTDIFIEFLYPAAILAIGYVVVNCPALSAMMERALASEVENVVLNLGSAARVILAKAPPLVGPQFTHLFNKDFGLNGL